MPLPANVRLLIDLAAVLKERRLRWYVFGAQAASYYGRPRMTEDVDVTVRVPPGKLRALIEALAKAKFEPRVAALEAFVERTRVMPFFHTRSRTPLDLVVASSGLEDDFLRRAKRVDLGGVKVPILSPEDVVITKVLGGRPQDLIDVRASSIGAGTRSTLGASGRCCGSSTTRSVTRTSSRRSSASCALRPDPCFSDPSREELRSEQGRGRGAKRRGGGHRDDVT